MLLTGSHTFPETQAPSRQNQRGIIVPHYAVSSMKLGTLAVSPEPSMRPDAWQMFCKCLPNRGKAADIPQPLGEWNTGPKTAALAAWARG